LKPKKKKLLKISLITIACLVVAYLGLSAFGSRVAMVIPRIPVTYKAGDLGVAYEDVSFKTRTGDITLKGWFLPGVKEQVIAFVHGGFQNRIDKNTDTPGLARALVEKGYNVLLFDLRGRGESEGRGITLSNIDADIGGVIDYLKSRGFKTEDICLLGFCSGATEACIYGSRNDVGSLILDGCFIDAGTMVVRQAQYVHLPGWVARIFIPGGTFFTYALYGFHRIDAISVIHDVKCPILFIHEENDPFTTREETERLFSRAVNPAKRIWEASGAIHSQGFIVHPQEYIQTVDDFLTKLPK
jgi:pimeloyl-ACP methyl ester carboxylesterase